MKKRYLVLLIMILLTIGCNMMGNTPAAKVEEVLKKYQSNSDAVRAELGDYLNTLNMNMTNRDAYQDIYLRQYSDLKYEIKNERIDGNRAVVTVEVTVYDYHKAEGILNNYINLHQADFFNDEGIFDENKAYQYRLDELRKVTERVTYTIDFTLTKNNGEWQIDNLTNEQLQKLHGTYAN